MNFEACLPIILQSEGGYANHPGDRGGPTNLGITIATLTAWEGHAATIAEVQALTPARVGPIYEANYWRAAACDFAPAGADLMIFDMAVNQGTGRAIRSAQTCLGLPADGVVGTQTRAALEQADGPNLILALTMDRESRYRALAQAPQEMQFLNGWLSRLYRTRDLAMKMAAA